MSPLDIAPLPQPHSLASQLLQFSPCEPVPRVGAGLPAKRPPNLAPRSQPPSLASQLLQFGPCEPVPRVGAGLPAKRPPDLAPLSRPHSLASQLLQFTSCEHAPGKMIIRPHQCQCSPSGNSWRPPCILNDEVLPFLLHACRGHRHAPSDYRFFSVAVFTLRLCNGQGGRRRCCHLSRGFRIAVLNIQGPQTHDSRP